MSVSRSVAEMLAEHVTLEVEGIDRMYLNVYVPALQRAGGVASFFRFHRGHQFASSVLMDPLAARRLQELSHEAVPQGRARLAHRNDHHDCSIGEDAFEKVVRPISVEGQRASAFMVRRCARAGIAQEMRALLAQLLGLDPAQYPVGRRTYDLRRLRLHGLIQRIPKSHRYDITPTGLLCSLPSSPRPRLDAGQPATET